MLYQNRASASYYGSIKGRDVGQELLNRLLAISPEAIAEAFEALIVEQVSNQPTRLRTLNQLKACMHACKRLLMACALGEGGGGCRCMDPASMPSIIHLWTHHHTVQGVPRKLPSACALQ